MVAGEELVLRPAKCSRDLQPGALVMVRLSPVLR